MKELSNKVIFCFLVSSAIINIAHADCDEKKKFLRNYQSGIKPIWAFLEMRLVSQLKAEVIEVEKLLLALGEKYETRKRQTIAAKEAYRQAQDIASKNEAAKNRIEALSSAKRAWANIQRARDNFKYFTTQLRDEYGIEVNMSCFPALSANFPDFYGHIVTKMEGPVVAGVSAKSVKAAPATRSPDSSGTADSAARSEGQEAATVAGPDAATGI